MNDANVFTQLPKVGPPIIEGFRLEGLNGYKTIAVRFEQNVKIISAENGAGKTTLLNALYALLTGNAERLRKINFKSLAIKFAGQDEMLVVKEELFPTTKRKNFKILDNPLFEWFQINGLSDNLIIEMLELLASNVPNALRLSEGFQRLVVLGISGDEIEFRCMRAIRYNEGSDIFHKTSDNVKETKKFENLCRDIKKILGDVSVLYFPTFRRIEADLPEYQKIHNASSRMSGDDWSNDRLIFFGLQDVTNKLKSITSDIEKGTFAAYSRISGRTLEQLLSVGKLNSEMQLDEGDIGRLRVVLARLGKTDSQAETSMFELIRSKDINKPEHQSLRSFLLQLLEVYQEKRDQELAVESFVNVVDSYWSQAGSEKRFRFDKEKVEAHAIDTYTDKPLPLNTLSSGEKQIVSIFARLYLNDSKRYLILIDEPELSLSMEWQQKFLPDVFAAPSCAQLIAITHSPFTFDNDLDPYAGSMEISYAPKVEQ